MSSTTRSFFTRARSRPEADLRKSRISIQRYRVGTSVSTCGLPTIASGDFELKVVPPPGNAFCRAGSPSRWDELGAID
jgi:hypothetical protein